MAKRTKLSNLVVSGQAAFLARLLDDGFIDIYDGQQPDSPDEDVTTQRLAVTLRFGKPAFTSADDGVISANPIQSGVASTEIKKATWARLTMSDHKTAVMDVSVGEKDANVIIPNTHIVRGVTVGCTSFSHSVAAETFGV